MIYLLENRRTATGPITFRTVTVDVQSIPELVFNVIVYEHTGSGHRVTIQLETSNDLVTWTAVTGASAVAPSALKSAFGTASAPDRPYGRYVRFEVELLNTIQATFSVVLATYDHD